MADDVSRISSRIAYESAWMRVREDEVRFADGSPGIYSVIEKNDFAVVIPSADDGFWLVQQFRYPIGRREWEFPQGGWPAGHGGTSAELARAELVEETGLRAGRLTHLGRLSAAPGHSSHGFDVFLAEDLAPGPPQRESTEADMVHAWFGEDDVTAMLRRGEFRDSNCVAALTLLHLHRRERDVPS